MNLDIFMQLRQIIAQTGNSANQQLNLNACRSRFIKPRDNLLVRQRVHLHANQSWTAGLGNLDLLINLAINKLPNAIW